MSVWSRWRPAIKRAGPLTRCTKADTEAAEAKTEVEETDAEEAAAFSAAVVSCKLLARLAPPRCLATASLRPTPIKRTRRRGSRDVKTVYLKTEAQKTQPLLTDADEAKAKAMADEGMFESQSQRDWCFEHPLLSN